MFDFASTSPLHRDFADYGKCWIATRAKPGPEVSLQGGGDFTVHRRHHPVPRPAGYRCSRDLHDRLAWIIPAKQSHFFFKFNLPWQHHEFPSCNSVWTALIVYRSASCFPNPSFYAFFCMCGRRGGVFEDRRDTSVLAELAEGGAGRAE